MPAGPGVYDAECTTIRESTNAQAVILVVFEGNRGSGFSVQMVAPLTSSLPDMLRRIADQIDQQGEWASTPPWSPDQVASLNAYQDSGRWHPFTCPDDRQTLIATKRGWFCPRCKYTQNWAHAWMLDWSWRTEIG